MIWKIQINLNIQNFKLILYLTTTYIKEKSAFSDESMDFLRSNSGRTICVLRMLIVYECDSCSESELFYTYLSDKRRHFPVSLCGIG